MVAVAGHQLRPRGDFPAARRVEIHHLRAVPPRRTGQHLVELDREAADGALLRAAAEARSIAEQQRDLLSGSTRRTPTRTPRGGIAEREAPEPGGADDAQVQQSDRRVRDASGQSNGDSVTLAPGRAPSPPSPRERLAAVESPLAPPVDGEVEPVVRGEESPLVPQTTLPETGKLNLREVAVARRRGRLANAATWVIAIGLAGFAGATTVKKCGDTGGTTGPAPAAAMPSMDPEANAAYEAGLQLWKDASTEAALTKFAEATRRDSGLAAAHLYYAAASTWEFPDVLTHFAAARALRGRLSATQAGLLDAIEPLMQHPTDQTKATQRLEALTAKFPDDAIAWMVRGTHFLRVKDPAGYLSIAAGHVQGALGFWLRGRAEELQDDLARARKSHHACVDASLQGGVDCLTWLARLEANEGECEESARVSKRLIAIDYSSPDGYRFLARAEFGRTHRTSAVRAILEERWARLPEGKRGIERGRDQFDLAILDGQFDHAYQALEEWDKAAPSTVDAHQRAVPFLDRVALETEFGHLDTALRTANAFIEASQTWLPEDTWDMPSERTHALYLTGQIDREAFRAQRARDEQGLIARGNWYAAASTRWYESYVENINDAEDARDAIAHQPQDHPFIDAAFRDLSVDSHLGRMYLYAGQIDKALEFFGRATKSCLYVKAINQMQTRAWYGDALALRNRPREACEQYAYVLQRWGQEPHSRTAHDVRESAIRLGCPGVAAGPRKTGK